MMESLLTKIFAQRPRMRSRPLQKIQIALVLEVQSPRQNLVPWRYLRLQWLAEPFAGGYKPYRPYRNPRSMKHSGGS